MDREINLDAIRALESQIKEHEGAIIRLKRTRNSFLNVSTLPPEILGAIFRWNVIPDGDFGGLPRGSYNFLLVCHHWLEVASRTPELWCFWGNTIQDWIHRYARCGTAPIDLVLDEGPYGTGRDFDDKLRDALQDRAARDTIRQVRLRGFHTAERLNCAISAIVNKGEEPRSISMESFIIHNGGRPSAAIVDVSTFFSRYHLPKLKHHHLFGCRISPQDLLKSRTTALTTLDLTSSELSPLFTSSQLLSILSSNPFLQHVELPPDSVTHADDDRSFGQVPLHHLRKLDLSNNFRLVFRLLNQLELPDKMDDLRLSLYECSTSDLSQTLGPYLGDRIRRRGRFPGGGLGLWISRSSTTVDLRIGDVPQGDGSGRLVWFVGVSASMSAKMGGEEADKLCFNLIGHVPQDQIVDLQTTLPILRSQELCVGMRNLTYLHLDEVDLSACFVEPNIRELHTSEKLLPSLDCIMISQPTLSGDDWTPFTDFLSRRAAVGNPISSLRFQGSRPHMDEDVSECIGRAVKDFEDEGSDEDEDSDEDEY